MDYDELITILVLGDYDVGKTSLLLRFVTQKYSSEKTTSVDCKFSFREVENKQVKFQIWDTPGQHSAQSMSTSYYRGVHGFIFVFDIANRQSFQNLSKWIKQAHIYSVNAQDRAIIVGHKSDLEENREVSMEEANKFAESNNYDYFETSAKNGDGVEDAFISIASVILNSSSKVRNRPSVPLSEIEDQNNNHSHRWRLKCI